MPRVSYKKRREFATDILEHAFFGAFYTAVAARKNEEGLTRAQLASRMGREKTGVSKLLAGPRNWQLSTIADLMAALGLRLEFSLIDTHFPSRRFNATGAIYNAPATTPFNQYPTISANNLLIDTNVSASAQGHKIDYQKSMFDFVVPVSSQSSYAVEIASSTGQTKAIAADQTPPPRPVLLPPSGTPTILGGVS
jgi:transcriptional regulator with XRE-family HTH domain